MSASNIPLRCACGAVRGVIDLSRDSMQRVVCYCDDCQAFARWLGRDVVDDRGGTDIVQVAPASLRITDGVDRLRSMKLTPKGLLRWYTDCCKTPAGNMLASRNSPFVGLPTAFVDRADGRPLDAVVGPSLGGIFGRFAVGGCPPGVAPKASLEVLLKSARFVFGNLLTGRLRPSPYLRDGAFLVAPRVLTAAERDALRS